MHCRLPVVTAAPPTSASHAHRMPCRLFPGRGLLLAVSDFFVDKIVLSQFAPKGPFKGE